MDSDSGEGLAADLLALFEKILGASEPTSIRMDSDCREGFLEGFLVFAGLGTGISSPAGIKIDSDSGKGVMEGFLMCSKEMPAGMELRVDPSLESVSAASLVARGT